MRIDFSPSTLTGGAAGIGRGDLPPEQRIALLSPRTGGRAAVQPLDLSQGARLRRLLNFGPFLVGDRQMREILLAAAMAAMFCSSSSAFGEGALAVGRATFSDGSFRDNFGMTWDNDTVGKARAGALAECREDPDVAEVYRIVATFRGECVSVAYPPEEVYGMGWGRGKDRATAERQALAECRADAEDPSGCRVDHTACDTH